MTTLEHLACTTRATATDPAGFLVVVALVIDEKGYEPYLDQFTAYECDGARPCTVTLPDPERLRIERLLLDQYTARCREDAHEDAVAAC